MVELFEFLSLGDEHFHALSVHSLFSEDELVVCLNFALYCGYILNHSHVLGFNLLDAAFSLFIELAYLRVNKFHLLDLSLHL